MPYGHVWRQHRRVFAQQFSASVESEEHHQIQRRYTQLFLRRLLNEPQDLREHIRYTFAVSIVEAVYGLEVAEKRDKNVRTSPSWRLLEGVQALAPGRFSCSTFQYCRKLPRGCPSLAAGSRAGRVAGELAAREGGAL